MLRKDGKLRCNRWYSFEDIKDEMYGPLGTPDRDKYEIWWLFQLVAGDIKEKRKGLGLTREALARKAGLDIKDIARMERGAVTTPIPKIHRVWLELGMNFVPGDRIYDDFHKEKRARKRRLTKQSSPIRTLVR